MGWLKRNFWGIFMVLIFLAMLVAFPGGLSSLREAASFSWQVLGGWRFVLEALLFLTIFSSFMGMLLWLRDQIGKPLRGIRRVVFTVLSLLFSLASTVGFLAGLWYIHSLPTGPTPGYEPAYGAVLGALTAIIGSGMLLFGEPALWALRLFRKRG